MSPITVVRRTTLCCSALMPADNRTKCAPVRDFDVELREFRVDDNAEGRLTDGDWRVFVDVGGQWALCERIAI